MAKLSHFDAKGHAHMVDVSDKDVTERVAVARGQVVMARDTFDLIAEGRAKKGDVLSVARLAGIMGAKKTPDLIPLCHPLAITKVAVELTLDPGMPGVQIEATVKTTGQTGVEMEALTAVGTAALTVYDMVKAADKGMGHLGHPGGSERRRKIRALRGDMISVDDALAKLFALVSPLPAETVPLIGAAGRVLAAEVCANRDQPPFSASAMDGYAIIADEADLHAQFKVIGESAAGHRFDGRVKPGQAVRIFTGAPVPEGASHVVIQEDVERRGDLMTITAPQRGSNIRALGNDFRVGDCVAAPRRLSPKT